MAKINWVKGFLIGSAALFGGIHLADKAGVGGQTDAEREAETAANKVRTEVLDKHAKIDNKLEGNKTFYLRDDNGVFSVDPKGLGTEAVLNYLDKTKISLSSNGDTLIYAGSLPVMGITPAGKSK